MKNWWNPSIYRVLKYLVKKSGTHISRQLRNSEYGTCLIIFQWYILGYKNICLVLYDFKPSSCKGDRWLAVMSIYCSIIFHDVILCSTIEIIAAYMDVYGWLIHRIALHI
jgi:hypothetical protein